MKKLNPTPSDQARNEASLEDYLIHTMIIHEKDWQKIRKLAKSNIKKAGR